MDCKDKWLQWICKGPLWNVMEMGFGCIFGPYDVAGIAIWPKNADPF